MLSDLAKSFGLLLAASVIGFLFFSAGFSEATIITVYLLGVLLNAISTRSKLMMVFASVAGVIIFNFFFTDPLFSLHANSSEYPVTFLVMLLASLLAGSLAGRLKDHAKQSAQGAWHRRLLLETNQRLQAAQSEADILAITARQLLAILGRDIVTCPLDAEGLCPPEVLLADPDAPADDYLTPQEEAVAAWVATNNKHAGAGTRIFADARCLYLAIRQGERVYGVVGIHTAQRPLDTLDRGILLSILGECALAMENRRNAQEKEAAAILAQNEQLRANLLRAVSHDLRTPLTSISGNAANLLAYGALFDEASRKAMLSDINEDALWLIHLVENLLSVSRLEDGRMQLHMATELIEEVVDEVLQHAKRRGSGHIFRVEAGEELLLAQMDGRLIVQVLVNLIDNAMKYTPSGTEITIRWARVGDSVALSVADQGPGIPDEEEPRIFDMYYSASGQIADRRRGMGLGLALCKSIVNAHGGEITVSDVSPHGTCFTFTLPAEEVTLHE